MQTLIDGTSREYRLMREEPMLRNWLLKCAETIGMTVHGDPIVRGFAWPDSEDETALSGYCFIKESGIEVHTYPEADAVFISVFSCKDFDVDRLREYIVDTWGMTEQPDVIVLQRGVSGKHRLPTRVTRTL